MLRFIRFALVGLVNTLVDFSILNLLAGWLRVPLQLSQVISFAGGVVTSFLLSRRFVYPEAHDGKVTNQLPVFLILNLIGLGIRSLLIPRLNGAFLGVFADVHIVNLTPDFVSRNLAWAISTLVVLLINFFGNRELTFRSKPAKEI